MVVFEKVQSESLSIAIQMTVFLSKVNKFGTFFRLKFQNLHFGTHLSEIRMDFQRPKRIHMEIRSFLRKVHFLFRMELSYKFHTSFWTRVRKNPKK
jgi:hypothetical protein